VSRLPFRNGRGLCSKQGKELLQALPGSNMRSEWRSEGTSHHRYECPQYPVPLPSVCYLPHHAPAIRLMNPRQCFQMWYIQTLILESEEQLFWGEQKIFFGSRVEGDVPGLSGFKMERTLRKE
jgi:hypothetical protein